MAGKIRICSGGGDEIPENIKFADDYADLSTAIDAIGASHKTLVISSSETLSANKTIPSTLSLWFGRGGDVTAANGVVCTIEAPILQGADDIFKTTGSGSFVIKNNNVEAHWFYAGGGDLGAKINAADTSLYRGGEILVRPGEYSFTTQITLHGGRALVSRGPGSNVDLDVYTPAPVRCIFTGTSPMITISKGSDSEGSTQTIQGFTFTTATSDPGTYTKTAIYVSNNCRKGFIQRCQFHYWDIAINLSGNTTTGQVFNVKHNTIRRCNKGIYVNGADHAIIAYNRLVDCKTAWIHVGSSGTYSVWIDHNNCGQTSATYDDGIVVDYGITVNITYNHLETTIAKAGARAIKILGNTYCGMTNIVGNWINFNSQSYGIELGGTVRGLNVQGNEFHGAEASTTAGIFNNTSELRNATAIGNMLYGCITKPLVDDDTGFVLLDNAGYTSNKGVCLLKFDERIAAPATLEDGQIVYADGATWNPGSGKGFYGRWSGTWNFLKGSGDFSDGGEAGGANRTLGNTDNYSLGFKTNNIVRLNLSNSGRVSIIKSLELPTTTASNVGVIYKGTDRFVHNYGTNNLFVGVNAGNFALTGNSSVALGSDCLVALTTGSNNIAVGKEALKTNTTGSNNTAVGKEALRDNITGLYNTALGTSALLNNTAGQYNTALGVNALLFNTTGEYNTAVGSGALSYNGVGYYNVGIGSNALLYNDTGYYNVGIGLETLKGVSVSSNISKNIAIGHKAGFSVLTGGDNNIFIGYQAGDNVTTGATNIIIGHDLDALSITADYQLNIGGTIFGDLGVTKKVGINTSTMNETLNVGGAIRLGTSALTNAGTIRWTGTDFEGRKGAAWVSLTAGAGGGGDFSDGGEAGGANRTLGNTDNYSLGFKTNNIVRLHVNHTGKIGIGTSSPSDVLHIYKSGVTALRIQSTSSYAELELTGVGTQNYITSDLALNFWVNGANRMFINTDGNIGINKTTSLGTKLDIDGNIRAWQTVVGGAVGEVCGTSRMLITGSGLATDCFAGWDIITGPTNSGATRNLVGREINVQESEADQGLKLSRTGKSSTILQIVPESTFDGRAGYNISFGVMFSRGSHTGNPRMHVGMVAEQFAITHGGDFMLLHGGNGAGDQPNAAMDLRDNWLCGVDTAAATLSYAFKTANNQPFVSRNAANNATKELIKLASDNQVQVGRQCINYVNLGQGGANANAVRIRVGGVNDKDVQVGAVDSGGAGYRMLRVVN